MLLKNTKHMYEFVGRNILVTIFFPVFLYSFDLALLPSSIYIFLKCSFDYETFELICNYYFNSIFFLNDEYVGLSHKPTVSLSRT